ncbi:MAG: peptidylprolyl isomerase [Bacteroidetes bacterium]|nr:peptidylprolyl isomerase [Bacteroidota bacterium]
MKRILVVAILFVTLNNTSTAQKKDFVITIKTAYGDIVAVLYDETPKHKANFIKLANAHFYDSTLFHRVITGFMIQGGDPNSKKAKKGEGLGSGGPGYTIEAEFNPKLFHKKGAIAAARMSDQQNPTKASNGSQFYIVQGKVTQPDELDGLKIDRQKTNTAMKAFLYKPEYKLYEDTLQRLRANRNVAAFNKKLIELAPLIEKETGINILKNISPEKIEAYSTDGGAPFLDDNYTVFGQVIKGFEVIDKIAMVKRDGANRPTEDVRMFVTAKEMSRKKISKKFDYQFPQSESKK